MTAPVLWLLPPESCDGSSAIYLVGEARRRAEATVSQWHYTRSVPAGKSAWFMVDEALICYSIPANKNLAQFVLGREGTVWELSRLWAPDGHEPNLLTRAIGSSIIALRIVEPSIEALVAFADPNAGHTGGVYRAASWIYDGQSAEVRMYQRGTIIRPRRQFHSGSTGVKKAVIEAMGYTEIKRPGKFRFIRGITKKARRDIVRRSRR